MPIFILSGTPGVGKTTIADELKKYNFNVIHLSKFAEEHSCFLDYDDERQTLIVDDDKLEKEISKYLKKLNDGINVLIEGHYADITPKRFIKKAFILSAPLREIRKRLELREYSESKIKENLEAEIMKECLLNAVDAYGDDKVIQISGTNVNEIVKLILSNIEQREIVGIK